jgi:CBS domain-containing membrane protein
MTSPSEQGNKSIELTGFEHVEVLLGHLQLKWLLRHFPARVVWAAYVCVNSFVTIALLAALAFFTGSPFVFPSLGPTAYLFFFSPMSEASSPRNAILGHAIGLICGYAAFKLSGVLGQPGSMHGGIHATTVVAAALSLAATGGLMVLFKVSHPPAGATTLIVSLGIISQPKDLFVIEMAVVLLTAQALMINRLAGVPYPFWRDRPAMAGK